MKKSILIIFTLLMSLALACGFNFSTANIAEAKMAKDAAGQEPTTVFNPAEPFYAVIELRNAPDDTIVKAVWTAVDVEGSEPNQLIDEVSLTSGDGSLQFDLTNDGSWPVGTYKVDLYLNDKLDRTLEFEVQGESVAQEPAPTEEATTPPTSEPTEEPTVTPEPTATPEPAEEPTATPEPTREVANSAGDSLAIASEEAATTEPTEESVETATEETEEYEPLPLQDEPYVHPSGAFSFAVPEGWELGYEDETSANVAQDNSVIGAVFVDAEITYTEQDMQDFIDAFVDSFVGTFADDYEIVDQQAVSDGSTFVALSYTSAEGNGDIDLFFEQRETVVFVFYFVSDTFAELEPTWIEVIGTYWVDPQAALVSLGAGSAPTAEPTLPPAPPTPTPVPANPYAPQAGRSRLYVFNEFNEELTFTINNTEHKIPVNGEVPIDLDPNRYTYTVSIPGGAANGEVTMGPNQSWAVGVRGDGAVYNPFQVYP